MFLREISRVWESIRFDELVGEQEDGLGGQFHTLGMSFQAILYNRFL